MAIIVEEEKKRISWFEITVVIAILLFLGMATYYLFFKPVPGMERIIVAPELESISKVSKITLDVASVTDSPVYKSLIRQIQDPNLGVFGRPNPFASF